MWTDHSLSAHTPKSLHQHIVRLDLSDHHMHYSFSLLQFDNLLRVYFRHIHLQHSVQLKVRNMLRKINKTCVK